MDAHFTVMNLSFHVHAIFHIVFDLEFVQKKERVRTVAFGQLAQQALVVKADVHVGFLDRTELVLDGIRDLFLEKRIQPFVFHRPDGVLLVEDGFIQDLIGSVRCDHVVALQHIQLTVSRHRSVQAAEDSGPEFFAQFADVDPRVHGNFHVRGRQVHRRRIGNQQDVIFCGSRKMRERRNDQKDVEPDRIHTAMFA